MLLIVNGIDYLSNMLSGANLKQLIKNKKVSFSSNVEKKLEGLLNSLDDYFNRYNTLLNKENSGKKMIEQMKFAQK